MTTATTTEIANDFGKFLALVQNGQEVIILQNGYEVARLVTGKKEKKSVTELLTGILPKEYDIGDKAIRAERIKNHENID